MPPKSNKNSQNVSPEEADTIAKATVSLLSPRFDQLEQLVEQCAKRVELERAKCNILLNHYKTDNNDQYQRRENIRIGNFAPSGDLVEEVVKLLNHMMFLGKEDNSVSQPESGLVDLFSSDSQPDNSLQSTESGTASGPPAFSARDISACHFTSPRQGSQKQVIVRFVSRQSVRTIYQHKKFLKKSPNPVYKVVYITDDITPLKLKTKLVVSKIPGVEKVFFRDGNVHCLYKQRHYKLSSPDDIFNQLKVDLTPEMMRDLGLDRFV